MKKLSTLIIVTSLVMSAALASSQCGGCGGEKKPPTSGSAKVDKGVQKATVVIDGGYTPSTIKAVKGKPIQITFVRKEASGCGGQVVFKSLGITKDVASGKKVVVTFTPKKAGTISFTCGMGMYQGSVVVK